MIGAEKREVPFLLSCIFFRRKTKIIVKGGGIRISVVHVVPYSVQTTMIYVSCQEMGFACSTGTGDPDNWLAESGIEQFEETFSWVVPYDVRA